jgi:hypothetical protein
MPLVRGCGRGLPPMQRSLNIQLPRGWYQVPNVTPHTFRRHGLATTSGSLQLTFHPPPDSPVQTGEQALEMLKAFLKEHHITPGTPVNSGSEPCEGGFMAFAMYKHVERGQCEYWYIPTEDAAILASWQMGAVATAGMERHDVHDMLCKIHFEDVED